MSPAEWQPAHNDPSDSSGHLPAEIRETHCAWVILIGESAYKLKKPLDLGFVDWRSAESRRLAGEREVTLNRQFAPDVYRGVAEVRLGSDEPCESLVAMRRMPDERRLSLLVTSGADVGDDLRAVARLLAAHHAVARRSPRIDAAGRAPALRARWDDNLAALAADRALVGAALDEVARLAHGYIDGRGELLDRRVAEGHVRDGHGDLLADDVFCLRDGPRVLDCLEFDDDLRAVDALDDAAVLAMDLERLGAPEEAQTFLADFVEFAGGPCPPSLVHHYVAYRAVMRAKIAAIRVRQGDAEAHEQVGQLLSIGLRHLRTGQPTLTLVGGLPGTGKSTLAAAVADACGAAVVQSDRMRKELIGEDPNQAHMEPWESGIYRPEITAHTYEGCRQRAARLLAMGESVVMDASWSSASARQAAREVAHKTRSGLRELCCTVAPEIARLRIAARSLAEPQPSDATFDIAARMAPDFAPWPEAVPIDTSGSAAETVRLALAVLGRQRAGNASVDGSAV